MMHCGRLLRCALASSVVPEHIHGTIVHERFDLSVNESAVRLCRSRNAPGVFSGSVLYVGCVSDWDFLLAKK